MIGRFPTHLVVRLLAFGAPFLTVFTGGCARPPSAGNAETGELTVLVKPELVNWHSMAVSWTTTFKDTLTLRYRLYIWENDTAKVLNLPATAYFELDRLSAGTDTITITGFEPSKTFYVWIVAFRENPALVIVRESLRIQFSTCASPYVSLSRPPRRVSGHRAAGVNGILYVVWPNQVFERFDPATNEWQELPQVPHAHSEFGVAALGGKLYVIGGTNSADIDVYDPSANTWSSRAPVPVNTDVRTAVTLRDTIFTFASTDQLRDDRPWVDYPTSRKMAAYVPATDSWYSRADRLGRGVAMGPVVPFQGKLYLFGSYASGITNYSFLQTSVSDSIYRFDPDANAWSYYDRMPDTRVGFHAAISAEPSYGEAIYIIGGLLELRRTVLTWTVPPILAYDGRQGWRLKTLPGAPLDFGEDAAVVTVGPTIYFVNGGDRWPGTTGGYSPEDDACGADIFVWEDMIPYGIPYTARETTKAARLPDFSNGRLIVGEPRPRQ